jgi:hypothetical protein
MCNDTNDRKGTEPTMSDPDFEIWERDVMETAEEMRGVGLTELADLFLDVANKLKTDRRLLRELGYPGKREDHS